MSSRQGARPARLKAATLTGGLWLFLLFGVLAPNALVWLAVPPPHNETALRQTRGMLHGQSIDDSWGVMMSAINYLKNPGTEPVYSELFFNRGQRFQYPLPSLFALEGMLRFAGVENVRINKDVIHEKTTLNDALGWGFIALGFLATFLLLERALKHAVLDGDTRTLKILRAFAVLGLTLTFYPIVKAYTLGQIQVWINAMFALALLCWAIGKSATSGFLMGVVTLIKPHFGLFLLWAALRRVWPFTISFAVTVGVGFAISLATYGLANHIDYIRVLRLLSETGELYYPNQSVNGVLNRLFALADPATYNNLDFSARAPYNIWVRIVTLGSAAFFIALGLLRRWPASDMGRARDFAIMGLCITLASPVAWEHHYGITLPMFALLAGVASNARELAWFGAAYILIGMYLPVTNLLAATPWNVAQSTLFVGAVSLLALLCRRQPPPAQPFHAP